MEVSSSFLQVIEDNGVVIFLKCSV